MRRTLFVIALVLLAPAARAADPPTAGRPLTVLPIGGDATVAARQSVEDRVRLAAGRYASVQAHEATAQALRSAEALGLSCDLGVVECARRMGGLAGAARVLVGALASDDTLTLGLLDVAAETAAAAPQRLRLPSPGLARDAAVERLVMLLLAPERLLGQLVVDVVPSGASVMVDDLFRGPAPLAAPITLPPGPHRVYATLPGFLSQTREIEVEVGTALRVRLELARDPDAPPPVVRDRGGDGDDHDDDEAPARVTVAVFPFLSSGVPARVAAVLDDAVAAELTRRDGLLVLAAHEVAGSLDTAAPGCKDDHRCLAEVARALDVDAFLIGRAAADGGLWTLTVSRHDAESGGELFAARTSALAQDHTSPLVSLPDVVDQLFPEHSVADGAPPIDVRGFAADMAASPLPTWVFWTAAGAGGVLAIATASAGVLALTANDPATAGRAGGAFAVGAGATVVALGAAAVIGAFVDWQ